MKTIELSFEGYQRDLFVSLFSGDGGDGYLDSEIEKANDIINENNLLSMVEASDIVNDEWVGLFITEY